VSYGLTTPAELADEEQFVTVPGVPVLDEHVMVDPEKNLRMNVDGKFLQEVCDNCNRRAAEKNNPVPLIVGHTSDDPQAPEKPVVGYAVNFRMAPWKNGKQAIYCDYKVRASHRNVIKDFPRRSVELWPDRKELDPIAILGGTTPERDLGDLGDPGTLTGVLKFSREGSVLRYRYTISETPTSAKDTKMAAEKPKKMQAEDVDDANPKDGPGVADAPDAGDDNDPQVAKVFSSKPWMVRGLYSRANTTCCA
jgi:hypothetical protein